MKKTLLILSKCFHEDIRTFTKLGMQFKILYAINFVAVMVKK